MRVGDPCMANSEVSQANFVASVYLVGARPEEWKWCNLYKFINENTFAKGRPIDWLFSDG